MITTTFQDIMIAAAVNAKRSRGVNNDKLNKDEQALLQDALASEFEMLVSAQPWPELIPEFANVTAANRQFSKNEGAANEMGDLLCVLTANPHTCRHWRSVRFTQGSGVVYVETDHTSLWVEYMLPYPGPALPELGTMTLANFLAAVCPRKFRKILAHKGAARLLDADSASEAGAAAKQDTLANMALAAEILRLPPIPAGRGFSTQ